MTKTKPFPFLAHFRANPFSGSIPKVLPWAILSWRFQRADAKPAATHYQRERRYIVCLGKVSDLRQSRRLEIA
jgi:hypothetical protein